MLAMLYKRILLVTILLSLLTTSVSVLKWEDIENEDEQQTTAQCILDSGRLEIHQNTVNTTKKGGEPEPKITPKFKFIVDQVAGTRLVVSSYVTQSKTYNFFAAMVLDSVTRLGDLLIQKKKPFYHEAKSQAELYYLWDPYIFKANLDAVNEEAGIIQYNSNGYLLKWLWSDFGNNMIGVYVPQKPNQKNQAKYVVAFGTRFFEGQPSVVEQFGANTLAQAEAKVVQALTDPHPFLDESWLDITQVENIYGSRGIVGIQDLRRLAAMQSGVKDSDYDKVILIGAKVLDSMAYKFVAVFSGKDPSILKSVMVGGMVMGGVMDMTLYAASKLGTDNELLRNYYTSAFTPHLLSAEGGYYWPWKLDSVLKSNIAFYAPKIIEEAPFTAEVENIYLQKIRVTNIGSRSVEIGVYSFKTKFFVAFLDHSNIVYVGGLQFPENTQHEASASIQTFYYPDKNSFPAKVEEALGGVLIEIQREFNNSKIILVPDFNASICNWIIEHKYVPAPLASRNDKIVSPVWYQLICKFPVKEPKKISEKFLSVLLVSTEQKARIPKEDGKITLSSSPEEAKRTFRKYFRIYHDRALEQARLIDKSWETLNME